MSSPRCFSGFRVTRSLVICVVLCRSLFVPSSLGHCVVCPCPSSLGHCIVCPSCPFSLGHCVVCPSCPSSLGHCVVCPSSIYGFKLHIGIFKLFLNKLHNYLTSEYHIYSFTFQWCASVSLCIPVATRIFTNKNVIDK